MKIKKEFFSLRDLGVVVISILLAIIIAQNDNLEKIITFDQRFSFLTSFLAGIFFISIFTVAPATVILVKIMNFNPVFFVAFFAGLGASAGDLLIFRLVKNNLTDGLINFLINRKKHRWKLFLKIKRLKFDWLLVGLGAFIIASPLPDELGLALMGVSKIKTTYFILLSFLLNFFGILIIGLIAV